MPLKTTYRGVRYTLAGGETSKARADHWAEIIRARGEIPKIVKDDKLINYYWILYRRKK